MAAEVNVHGIVPQCKAIVQSRFSSLRFMKVVKQFNPMQTKYLPNHNLGHLLNLPEHLMIPMHFLQWLVSHTSYGDTRFLQHEHKLINFTKDMVDKVFGFPNGHKPFVLDSNDPEIVREVEQLREEYVKSGTISVKDVELVLLGAQSEVVFIQNFILFFIQTILCPPTYNSVNQKYLYSPRDSDISEIENFDFGTLCLEYLWSEMNTWKDKITKDSTDRKRLTWIGGCLPLLAVVYMDFLDFNGNAGPINYNLPRINFIKNGDFVHVVNLDRNYMSPESYGILPIRDMSVTPYSVPLAIAPPDVELPLHNAIADAAVNEVLDQLVQPEEIVQNDLVQDAFIENVQDVMHNVHGNVDVYSPGSYSNEQDGSDVDIGSLGSYTIEPEDSDYYHEFASSSPDSDALNIDNNLNQFTLDNLNIGQAEGTDGIGDGLMNIANTYANFSDNDPIIDIHRGLQIAMSYANLPDINDAITSEGISHQSCNQTPGPNTVQNSFEKRNRKKRAAKTSSPDRLMPELVIDSYIEEFYSKFIRTKMFETEHSPTVIQITSCSVSYEFFSKSFKSCGDVTDETMCLHSEIFNDRARVDALSKPFIKKYMFNTYISEKLVEEPSVFNKNWVVGQFKRVMNVDFEIPEMDIQHSSIFLPWSLNNGSC